VKFLLRYKIIKVIVTTNYTILPHLHRQFAVIMTALCRYKYKLHSKQWKIGNHKFVRIMKNFYIRILDLSNP